VSVEAIVARLAGRVRLSIGRAMLGLVNDAAKLQAVQVTLRADEVRANAEHFQHYGFTSVPLPGAEGIGLAVGGSTDHMVVINIDDRRYRLKALAEGEVALYDDQGQKIHFTRDGIVIDGAGKGIVFQNAPSVDFNDVEIVRHNGTNIGDSHTHLEQGDGQPVSPPQ
jgi:phage baseplate assembly protein V